MKPETIKRRIFLSGRLRKISLILGLTFSGQVLAETACQVPSFIVEGKNYYIETTKKELFVKVRKVDANSCWIKVREQFHSSVDETMLPEKRKSVFWINVENLVVVRKESQAAVATKSMETEKK